MEKLAVFLLFFTMIVSGIVVLNAIRTSEFERNVIGVYVLTFACVVATLLTNITT